MKTKLSVLMPVYNAEQYLEEAIKSILSQTYKDFEFLIIDDGSTDSSPKIIQEHAKADSRIKAISHETNMGLVATLNEGLKKANGLYIARMDADDISESDRFKKQVDFLDSHKDHVVVGASFISLHPDGTSHGQHYCFINDLVIRHALTLEGCIPHPTAMFRRKEVLELGGYREEYYRAEDYDLWRRISKVGKLHNIETPLLKYRHLVASGISANKNKQKSVADKIKSEELGRRSNKELKVSLNQLTLPGEHIPALLDLHKRLARAAFKSKRFGLWIFLVIDLIKFRIK